MGVGRLVLGDVEQSNAKTPYQTGKISSRDGQGGAKGAFDRPLMQQWYSLSESAMEDALINVLTMRLVPGMNLHRICMLD
jgi:hypothetical protein